MLVGGVEDRGERGGGSTHGGGGAHRLATLSATWSVADLNTMRKRKSGSSAILAHRRNISIPVLSFDKGVCTVSNLKDEMPQNPIINESMAILMMPRF